MPPRRQLGQPGAVLHPQLKFEKELRTSVELNFSQFGAQPFWHRAPPRYQGHGLLDITKYYIHDVLIIAPHLQFPDITISCECGHGVYRAQQWNDRRVIHGLDQPVTLLQYRYKCDSCKKHMVAFELAKTEKCPEIIRLQYSSLCYLTHNGGVTGDVLQLILDEAVSKLSFEDIQMQLSTLRKNTYLQARTEYEVAKDHFCQERGVHLDDMPQFSAMDDPAHYNVSVTEPQASYVIDVFLAVVNENKDQMAAAFKNRFPSIILSADHTFNCPKRTVDFVAALPPERLPPGTTGHSSYSPVEKNALLIVMGANGEVSI
jgi:hypothetical protein